MQTWDKDIQGQLNNLHSFPRAEQWVLGDWIDECHVRPEVADFASLPMTNNELGDLRATVADKAWFIWDGMAWQPMTGGGGGVNSVGAVAPISSTGGFNPIISHDASGVVAGTYGDATNVSRVTVDAKGHVTSATATPIAFPAAPVQSITGTAPINVTAGANPVVSHNNSGVVAGTYGDAANSARVTVDAKGHVTAATTVPISITAPVGTFILGTGPVQTISSANDQITPVAPLHRIQTNGVNHTLMSMPTINLPGAVIGQVQIILNVDTTGRHVTLQKGPAGDHALSLSNASKQIDPGGTITLVFDGSVWVELTHIAGTNT